MKREIKFRAWDTGYKKWYAPTHEAYKGNLFELMVGFGGDLSAHTMNGMIHESMWPNRYVLMQFTGLHDKNGKEVCEGDILCNPNQLKGIVVYYEAGFYLEAKRKNGTVWFIPLNSGMLRNKEIIGNIYENEKD